MGIDKRKITDLVEENYVYASVLFYFGIQFYDYSEKTLEEVCNERGIKVNTLIEALEQINKKGEEYDLFLMSYPIDLIVEYLRHTHYIFIKRKLPFLIRLIENIKCDEAEYVSVIKDLKFVLPLFVEDLIHHIYEEEDTLFTYVLSLNKALKGNFNQGELYYYMEKNTIQKYAVEHEVHDDEMRGIRNITKNYLIDNNTPQSIKVLYAAMKDFESELEVHVKVENEVLFPKALMLEKELRKVLREKVVLN